MADLLIQEHGVEALEDIRPLWEHLNEHHRDVSAHFAAHFAANPFKRRRDQLAALARSGELRLFLAHDGENTDPCGYCAAHVSPDRAGEILSIFVDRSHRERGAGDLLMRAALKWLESRGAHPVTVGVVHGNEQAWRFYERYGFKPRSTILSRD